ncbi:hypothetical protein, partial [Klebsiella pneumoniae]|uniref:hypothetical protein n=1 Tax=Klebsiella pneumoniae TaxID=573 RepID=UPI002FEFB2E7
SYPVGVLADRVGHLPVLIAGYVLGTLTAVLTALAFWLGIASVPLLAGVFFIAGLYVAVQEALESTVTAEMVQPDTLAMSYGALAPSMALPSSFPAPRSAWCGRRSRLWSVSGWRPC